MFSDVVELCSKWPAHKMCMELVTPGSLPQRQHLLPSQEALNMLDNELRGLNQTIDSCCSDHSAGTVGGAGSEHISACTQTILCPWMIACPSKKEAPAVHFSDISSQVTH